jgi:hypothetical protein
VDLLLGGENIAEYPQGPGGKFRRRQIGLQKRALHPFGFLKKKRRGLEIIGKDTAGDTVGKHPLDVFSLSLPLKHSQTGGFTLAEELNPLMGEEFIKPQQSLARPVQFGAAYFPGQALPPADTPQIQRIVISQFKIEQIKNSETLVGHGSIVE